MRWVFLVLWLFVGFIITPLAWDSGPGDQGFLMTVGIYWLVTIVSAGWIVFITVSVWRFRDYTDRKVFVIKREDYERQNEVDYSYRNRWFLAVMLEFGNRCAKCGAMDNGVHLDHAFIPKSQGGNFAMRHKHGFWVNNAVLLCRSCNTSKGARPFWLFFGRVDGLRIMEINKRLTRQLQGWKPR